MQSTAARLPEVGRLQPLHEIVAFAQAPQSGGELLTRQALAARWNISERFLERLAVDGGGPPMVRLGRAVRYPVREADEWARRRIVAHTSEATVRERKAG